MSNKIKWDWDPIHIGPRYRSRSRPQRQLVECSHLLVTRTTTDLDDGAQHFRPFKAIADAYRRRRRLQGPAVNWSFEKNMPDISSDESTDESETQTQTSDSNKPQLETNDSIQMAVDIEDKETNVEKTDIEKDDTNIVITEDIENESNFDKEKHTEKETIEAEEVEKESDLESHFEDEEPNVEIDDDEEEANVEIETEIEKVNEEIEIRLRRSKRHRMPKLEYWRGQRPVYKRDSSGLTEKVVDIFQGIEYLPKQRKSRPKKRKTESEERPLKTIDVFNLSIHNKKVNTNDTDQDIKKSLNIKSLEDLVWKRSKLNTGVDIAIINKNKTKGDANGMMRLESMAKKNKSKTGDYNTHLTVTYGALALKIEDNPIVKVKTGFSFTVEANTNYELQNLRKDTAYVSFNVVKA